VPDGCPTLDRFGLAEYDEFNKHFLGWLREIERIKFGLSAPTDTVVSPPKSSLPADLDGLIQMESEEPRSAKQKPGRSKGKGKAKAKDAVKRKGNKKGSKSKREAMDVEESAESEFSLEFHDDSGGEAAIEGSGKDDEEHDELEDEGIGGDVEGGEESEDEEEVELDEDRPRGPPMSAYEVAREANIERIRNIW
ncbi:hypothetical protein V5O48_019551, partial [Marasmius crinis-equi]